MQTVALPKGVCAEIEKKTRRFIWGKNEQTGGNKISLVNWELVTTGKAKGRLGLRKLHEMNNVCMAKLYWRYRTEASALWARTLASKYKHRVGATMDVSSRREISNVWRGMCNANVILEKGVMHIVQDGASTRFWMDVWLTSYSLYEKLLRLLSLPELYANVDEYWDQYRGWKWEKLEPFLPREDLEALAAFGLTEAGNPDEWGWKLDPRGRFSVKSAYSKREDLNHLFRECKAARPIWEDSLHWRLREKLRTVDWTEWFTVNLRGDAKDGFADDWPEIFYIRLWWIWKWRNEDVFNEMNTPVDQRLAWLRKYDKEVLGAFKSKKVARHGQNIYVDTRISWTKPPPGWLKLNVDGSYRRNGLASCGGVLRDENGDWCKGFAYNIGRCSAKAEEAWGVLQGLRVAKDFGASRIIVECDSKATMESLCEKEGWRSQCHNIGRLCMREALGLVEVRYTHVFREQNRVADKLATMDEGGGVVFYAIMTYLRMRSLSCYLWTRRQGGEGFDVNADEIDGYYVVSSHLIKGGDEVMNNEQNNVGEGEMYGPKGQCYSQSSLEPLHVAWMGTFFP
ncbi:PREDICTED: uncharacterized protein LOC109193400 [Ipomoea nil]|uniref:uncharacterized protein LOC109193400 n=1 Tax=Ipomoea nil TaxID=35883 RepID=UPI000900D91F|nr:PREDICTED: uncharacterized protein LOC109193400 [Ipomoea nil]